MQTPQITTEQRIKEEFERECPSKQTDLSKKRNYDGYYNLRQLDMIINQTFERFAYSKDFQKIVSEKPEVIEAMKRIKRMYHDKIISYDFPVNTFEHMHIRELRGILDTSLDSGEFYKRLQELEMYLVVTEKTMISDELRYAFINEEKRKMKEEKTRVYRLLKEEIDKDSRNAKSLPRKTVPVTGEQLRRGLNQNNLNYIRATPSLSLCVKNSESCELIPQLKLLIGKDEYTDGKLSEIFSNSQTSAYGNFIRRIRETMQTKNMVLENILKREAVKSGKQFSKFKIIDLNPATWNWLASYYNSDKQVKNFVWKYRQDYAKSLKDLVDETYSEMLKDSGSWN